MNPAKTHKIRWKNSTRSIPDLGLRVSPGDVIEVPSRLSFGGEGLDWEKVKAPAKAKAPKAKTATAPPSPEGD